MTYNDNWRSPENEKLRADAEREQLDRDYAQAKEGLATYVFRPMAYAIAWTIWIMLAIKHLDPIVE
jgi:hypothetical protein